MDINDLRVVMTVASFAVFIGIVLVAWSDKRRRAFDEAAQLPFADDDLPAGEKSQSNVSGDRQ